MLCSRLLSAVAKSALAPASLLPSISGALRRLHRLLLVHL